MPKLAKYELLTKIASGGMAEIHVARTRDGDGGRVCVVKKLLPQHSTNEDYIQMFLDEGRIAAMFDHPNIVRMHDFGSEDGNYYLAMEYLHGEDLRMVLRALRSRGQSFPVSLAVGIISAVCAGLHHAHEMSGPTGEALEIVHRDISPHNVFVTFDGAVKVVDFGIAKSVDRNWETKHGTLKGKIPYMAPEQIKGRRLDRRGDIYAAGVLLYELVLGRRPYVLAAGGDFAMMMAIARHDIRAPSSVDPTISPELERIILEAIAYDPKHRYATAHDLRRDLDAFAQTAKLDTSPGALASFLAGLFEARVDEWRAAQLAESDLAAHAVHVEEVRAQSGLHDDEGEDSTEVDELAGSSTVAKPPSVLPPGSAASLVVSTSAAVAGVLELFGVTVVTLQGRIDESFDGKALGGSLSGTVLFDLSAVERVTSFGVREWLEMMSTLDATEDVDAFLARCPETVVTQLAMIRSFAGRATVVSFDVPFLCDDCGNSFVRLLDCVHDAAIIAGDERPTATCPRCGGEAKLDDDPAYLTFAVPFAVKQVPERIRVAVQRLDEAARGGGDGVDKVVSASETRVRIHRDVDPSFRWNRVLDGIEGVVVVDFRGAERFGREAAARFARAIGALGSEVTSCEILECPVEVAGALGSLTANRRPRVASLAFEGRCASCAAARTGTVGIEALEEAHRAEHALFVPCRRCNGPLVLGDVAWAVKALVGSKSAPRVASSEGSSRSPGIVPADASAAESGAAGQTDLATASPSVAALSVGTGSRRPWLLAGAVVLASLAIGGGVTVARRAMRAAATAASAPSNASSQVAVRDPQRAQDAVERRADGVEATVTIRAPDEDRALSDARAGALGRLLIALEHDLEPTVLAADEAIGPPTSEGRAASLFVDQVGSFASPDRIDVRRRVEDGAVVLTATYRISAMAWQRAISYYSQTRSVGGLTFAVAFPLRGSGLVVVASEATRMRTMPVGSLVAEIDAHPVTSLEPLASLNRGPHGVTGSLHDVRFVAKLDVR